VCTVYSLECLLCTKNIAPADCSGLGAFVVVALCNNQEWIKSSGKSHYCGV